MSWDFRMGVRVAADGGIVSLANYEANYTFNVAPMFYDAIGEYGIRGLNERTGEACLPVLEAAIRKMEENPGHYRVMNPPNGWGDYDGALNLLKELASWCREVPSALLLVR